MEKIVALSYERPAKMDEAVTTSTITWQWI